MKKLFFLLFCVCVCLATPAAILHNKNEGHNKTHPNKSLKTNMFSNLPIPTASADSFHKKYMDGAKKSLEAKKNSHNNPENQIGHRSWSKDAIANTPYICYLYAYTYDENGNHVQSNSFYDGGGAYWDDTDNELYFYGLYWPWDANSDPDYLPLDIDYQTGDVTLNYYHLLRDDTISSNAGGRNRNDTIRREFLVSEAYFLNEEPTDCKGTLYEDGSIVFQDNYVYYGYQTINIYISNQLMGTQTEEFVKVYIGTEILAANGMHTFSLEKNGPTYSCNVHMFQNETNDTLFVGNLWELGMPDVILTIDEDANMHYNCISETENGKTYYNPIWDVNDAWISIGFGWFYGISDYTHPTSNIHWGFEGKVTPETITWDHSTLYNGYYIYNDSYNNVLTWLDDSEFRIPEGSTPITNIRGDVNNNGEVDIYDIITLIDYLRCIESDEPSGISLECADCNQDGIIDWNDVTSIYNYLEMGGWSE